MNRYDELDHRNNRAISHHFKSPASANKEVSGGAETNSILVNL
ncbi:hypothetical protein ACFLZM_05950 [Thermodesulfobacteriota bacterium]